MAHQWVKTGTMFQWWMLASLWLISEVELWPDNLYVTQANYDPSMRRVCHYCVTRLWSVSWSVSTTTRPNSLYQSPTSCTTPCVELVWRNLLWQGCSVGWPWSPLQARPGGDQSPAARMECAGPVRWCRQWAGTELLSPVITLVIELNTCVMWIQCKWVSHTVSPVKVNIFSEHWKLQQVTELQSIDECEYA